MLESVASEALALTESGKLHWEKTPRKSVFLSNPYISGVMKGSVSLLVGPLVGMIIMNVFGNNVGDTSKTPDKEKQVVDELYKKASECHN